MKNSKRPLDSVFLPVTKFQELSSGPQAHTQHSAVASSTHGDFRAFPTVSILAKCRVAVMPFEITIRTVPTVPSYGAPYE